MDSYHKILGFPQQFLWKPEIEHLDDKKFEIHSPVVICGMGGSALAGDSIRTWLHRNDLIIHRDFHLPKQPFKLVIAVSYSGNTEETLSAAHEAQDKKIPLFLIASGGALEAMSHDLGIPFIKLPQGFEPREALGFMIRALVEFLAPHRNKELEVLAKISGKSGIAKGRRLSKILLGTIPLIYASQNTASLAYTWKIKFNETGKTPAFTASIPELFHNEMTGFDAGKKTQKNAGRFVFILLENPDDSPEIKKRIQTFKKFIGSKGFTVIHEKLSGDTFMERHVRSINLADWTSYFLAKNSGADPEHVPWVEEFKTIARSHHD